MKRLIVAALVLGTLVTGCIAAAHLKALHPGTVPPSPPLHVPQAVTVTRPAFQRGIDIDAYTSAGLDFSAAAAADVRYVRSLHANAVSISFPFFMNGPDSSQVFATDRTPLPAQLALLIQDAEQAGLYVSIRPLLDEASLHHSRVAWKPADPKAWFASYLRSVLPYARMAQKNNVSEFIVGAEFSLFGSSPRWNALDRAIQRVFHGTLAYSNNDTTGLSAGSGGRLAIKAVDSYHPVRPPLLPGWKAFDRRLPPGAVLTEVGIAAVAGAWRAPWVHRWPTARLDPQVQARWFTAACHAAEATHLGGIYFWSIFLGISLPGPTPSNQGSWAHSAGATAIARCFEVISR